MKSKFKDPYEDLPEEAFKKHQKFVSAYNIYFKNQSIAGSALKVSQATISRFLSGVLLIPCDVAKRFEKFTNGNILAEDIYFDAKEYEHSIKKNVNSNVISKKVA